MESTGKLDPVLEVIAGCDGSDARTEAVRKSTNTGRDGSRTRTWCEDHPSLKWCQQ